MLMIALVSLLPKEASVTFNDGKTVPARSNYGGVAKSYANIVGERYAKNLTFFADNHETFALFDGSQHWTVLKETYSKDYGKGYNVEFVGTPTQCTKFIEKFNKPVVSNDVFGEVFGERIIKAKVKDDEPHHEFNAGDEEDEEMPAY